MLKVKTITCHDVYNAGASLQAYALAAYLKGLGHDVEIIDYKPDYLNSYFSLTAVSPAYDKPGLRELYLLGKLPGRLKRKYSRRRREYDAFTAGYLPVTATRYASNEELKRDLPRADVYFAGSDQIWNTLFNNGKDPAFYLDFAPKESVKASYAASFAVEDIAEEWKGSVRQWLTGLDYISVRESSGVGIIERLGLSGAVQVLDPVFLLDAAAWAGLEQSVAGDRPYLLVYDFDRSEDVSEFSRRIAKERGWKIYSVLPCKFADKCFEQEGPRAFVDLVHHAQFVVSNSFHATAFSLIFQKPFAVFGRRENINARMKDLLKLVGLEDRMVLNWDDLTDWAAIDYAAVDQKLSAGISASKQFIFDVMKGAGQKECKRKSCL